MKPVTPPVDDSLPKFFRVYMPGISGDDMELPVSFNSFLPTPLPKYVTLKSIYGKIWKMALRRCVGDVERRYVLLNGWKRIAKDESLTSGNVLEFEFDGSQCFKFCIYESPTMCKRLARTSVQSEEETEEAEADDVLVLSDDDDDDDSQDADYNCADDDNDDVILDDDDVSAADDDEDVVTLDGSDDDDDTEANHDDERRYLDDRSNAFFPVTINPKKISQLRIPTKVIKDFGLNFSESITLVDPLVKKFGKLPTKIKIQTNNSVFIKGYGAVIRRNGLTSADKMICEIKKAGSNNMVHTIKFHIIK
ncbi:B3 domain-containing protein At5g60130-like [Raphanus sativus]|uniref:B3 domain-containing protein At5g60130-like n=1 Tax=Raphanus sativus TaxID=3726 RepID=A0A6J0LYJ9_RAPSA|nr:B3 domain-containing protein At5g60130-like [Raphanus sativus]